MTYIRPSSRLICAPSLALGLHTANLPIPPAAADGVQRGPAAVAAPSITRRMSGRAAQASPGAPWPRTGPDGLYTRRWRQKKREGGNLGTGRFCPARSRGRGSPRRGRTKAAPGRMLLPDSPLRRAAATHSRASLCAAPASRLGVGAHCRLSPGLLPFAALPSSSACPTPALLSAPDSCGHLFRGWRCDPVQGGAVRAAIPWSQNRALGARGQSLIRSSPAQQETWVLHSCRTRLQDALLKRVGDKSLGRNPLAKLRSSPAVSTDVPS